ncbi:tetraacyldisaccharide 4'-kinase [Wolinella succinogenes]|uniref:tetraacyldisaccharide 4'-kinase n=1 Tax=Wolinella succinogenes TaxID=844 RepID=UPI0016A86FEC|nr:tetraacyldisaccharide 4'-kinase [Wolinella succinogenes]NLU34110.1 tetraacyldisaccharide 4'-kinase [Wolinella succinogenes]
MRFIERYFYRPSPIQKGVALALLPLSLLYCAIATTRRALSLKREFPATLISIGNLVVGGTGKTPFLIALAKEYEDRVAVVSRGYKRGSKGLLVVSHEGKILEETPKSGDEAMLIAQKLPKATVIVSEDRAKGINKAIELGKDIIFLDDGFRFPYNKLNILLRPLLEPHFKLCIPSGAYRERPSLYQSADILAKEGKEYRREVNISNPTPRMLLVTAIANPSRLERFLPEVVGKIAYKDHAFFDIKTLQKAMKEHEASSLLVTEKDEVKLKESGLPLSVMRLEFFIDEEIRAQVREFVASRPPKLS